MTSQEFDTTRWGKGMKVRTQLHTLTQGTVTIECEVIGVNFAQDSLTLQSLSNGGVVHRGFEDVELIKE